MGLWSAGAALNVLQLGSQLEAGVRKSAWLAYNDILGIIGMGLLAEAVSFLCHGALDWRIFILGSALGTLFWAVQLWRPSTAHLAHNWRTIPAWTATLLFMVEPVASLARFPAFCLHS